MCRHHGTINYILTQAHTLQGLPKKSFTFEQRHANVLYIVNKKEGGKCAYNLRAGFSCVTQLTELIHNFAGALHQGFSVDCIILFFAKAFDVVSHSLLLEKLPLYNINPEIVRWIQEYLNCQKQRVVNGQQSEDVDVSSGVPQGSVFVLAIYYFSFL